MIFGYFLMIVAVTIAGVSAYFSVYGLAHIFTATFWSVVIMGGVLEVGKLVATSFLYRYWSAIGWYLRAYLLVAIVGLMAITSAGIFGYLSNAYQQDTVGVKDVAARIELLDTELASLSSRDQQINLDIDRIGSNFVTARQNMIKQYAPEKSKITERIAIIRTEKLDLSTKQLEVEAHTGPIIYIAKAMGKGIDDAVMWMILLIIVVFDPLAVALTLGANIVLTKRPDRQERRPRPSYLNDDVLTKAAVAGEARLQALMYAEQSRLDQIATLEKTVTDLQNQPEPEPIIKHVEVAAPIPAGMQLVESGNYQALREAMIQTANDFEALESEITHKQDLVEELSTDNQRLEEEIFTLGSAFLKKEQQVAQLKEAIKALEQQGTYTIEQRASLHAQNVLNNKTH